jgi:tetratricopeptide (TPR) repeat protein
VGLAILFAVPAAALDVGVDWSLENAPTVVTLGVTDITQDSALLEGSLAGLGGEASVSVSFEWGASPALGQETTPQTMTVPTAFEATIQGLSPDSSYYYRAKAEGNGTTLGETLSFQTSPAATTGDLFSQLWLWLVLAAIGAVMGYLLTRRQLAGRRETREPGETTQKTRKAKKARGGFFAKAGGILAVAKRASKAPAADLGGAVGSTASSEILCPRCGTELADTAVYCFGCGRGLTEGADLDERIGRAQGALAENERDRDALFTVGAHLAAAGEAQEAIEVLNKLTMLDPHYPGLWWVKARVFEALGNPKAAEAAMVRAMRTDQSAGVEALLTATGGTAATVGTAAPAPSRSETEDASGERTDEASTCTHCSATIEVGEGNCPNCGHSVLDQGEVLEEKVGRAIAILELDEDDTDALFTLGAYLLLDGKVEKALETLNRLTLLDPTYPGLWWVKARVFEKLGNAKAAESAIARAQQGDEESMDE